jgi:hypothetical protein
MAARHCLEQLLREIAGKANAVGIVGSARHVLDAIEPDLGIFTVALPLLISMRAAGYERASAPVNPVKVVLKATRPELPFSPICTVRESPKGTSVVTSGTAEKKAKKPD